MIGVLFTALVLGGCAASKPYALGPIKTEDPDRKPIPRPEEKDVNITWDIYDLTFIAPVEKVLDLNWVSQQAGRAVGLGGVRQADNVNVLDEVPASSWYTPRHYHQRMPLEELARGPNTLAGPSAEGPWTVVSAKSEGASKGFVIKDARGDRYVLKFGNHPYEELPTAAEVITTKIFHAAGYYVPENYIAYFDPGALRVDEEAEIETEEGDRPMTREDVALILDGQARRADGKVRALASKYVDGRPVGIWEFRGTREDDPNDRVAHEHRRELRALRVIGSWLNDTDRRSNNTLAVYTDEQYIKHYLLDMGSSLGANASSFHTARHGHEYKYDPRTIGAAVLSLGLYERPWLFADAEAMIRYPAVGFFESEWFDPGTWVPVYPVPAFQNLTLRDALWGAKIVMSFTDEDLAAIVETAEISDPAAEAYLLQILRERRDKVGRYWFSRINPLDRFRLGEKALRSTLHSEQSGQALHITFDDLAVGSGLESAQRTTYRYRITHGGKRLADGVVPHPEIPLALSDGESLSAWLERTGQRAEHDRILRVTLNTIRNGEAMSDVHVYLHFPGPNADPRVGQAPRVAGIQREEPKMTWSE